MLINLARGARRAAVRLSAVVIVAMLLVPASTRAAQADGIEAKADRIIEKTMKEKGIPGLALAIVRNGKVVLKKGYGVKAPGEGAPDENTVFSIGSLSKALTAFGAMQLLDEGKLSLDEPASKYLRGMPKAWRSITVRQFMTHTSGIPQKKGNVPTFAAAMESMGRQPMAFAPGTDQEYNNFNFAILGKIIESIAGEPYVDYMQSRVFGPLAMHDTGESGTVKTSDRAAGHAPGRDKVVNPGSHAEYSIPSGFLESSVSDLLRFDEAMVHRSLLKPHTYEEMFTPTVIRGKHYGWSFTPGWQMRKAGNVTVIAKNGEVTGFSSQFHFVPERNDAVIMLWNTKGKGLDLWGTAGDLLNECLGVPKAK